MEETAPRQRLIPEVGRSDGNVSPALLEACRRGDREAMRALYDAYKDGVYSLALYYFHGDAAAAADVTQQVFLTVLRQLTHYRGQAAFSTWLYRVTTNACIDRSRRTKRERSAEPDALNAVADARPSHEERLVLGEMANAIQQAVSALPPKLRSAILLRYFEDLSYTEMAAALNCSVGTVASRLSRGHRLLARQLAALRSPAKVKG